MWEPSIWHPQGSISLRKIFAFATALLVACFVYIIASAPMASAADAEFSENTLSYEGKQFSGPFTADGTRPSGVAQGVKYYVSPGETDPTQGTVIYFSRGIEPTEATSARATTATLDGSGGVVSIATNAAKEITVGTSSSPDPPSSSCKLDGVGWFVCNLSNWIAEGVDYLYSILTKFLIYTPLTEAGSTNSIYQLWNAVRNLANVAFVIAFIVIIYSEMTTNFLGSYTVKKLLPRIIVAAILVNVSFWICAIAIDLSNIIGVAIQDLFSNLRQSLGAANTVDLPGWGDVTAALLAGGGITLAGGALLVATGGSIGGLVFLLLGALIPAIFAALVAVAVLAARQALITVLVVLAPLAFVAYLLPNTEQWFDKWRKFFMTLLIMFPAFSLLFGGSQIAGAIIIQNARDISVALLGLTVQVVPLFITPFLIKLSSGLLGTIAGLANDKSKGIFDRTKTWADNNRKMHQQKGFSKDQRRERKASLRPTSLAQRLNNRTLEREGKTSAYQESAAEHFHGTKKYSKIDDLKRRTAQDKMRNEGLHDQHWYSQMDKGSSHFNQAIYDRELAARRAAGEGTEAKNLSEKQSEAYWENFALTDTNTRRVRAATQSQTLKAQEAKEAWDNIVLSLESGKADASVKAEFGNVSVDINENSRKLAARALEKAGNSAMKNLDFAEEIQLSSSLQTIAAGVDPNGAQRALANAVNTVESAHEETIKHVTELMEDKNLTDDQIIDSIVYGQVGQVNAHGITVTEDMQEAAIRKISASGNNFALLRMMTGKDTSGNVVSPGVMATSNDRHRRALTRMLKSNSARQKFIGFGAMSDIEQGAAWTAQPDAFDIMVQKTLNANKFTTEALVRNLDEDGAKQLAATITNRGADYFNPTNLANFRQQLIKAYNDDDYNGLIGERDESYRQIARTLGFEDQLPRPEDIR